MKYNSLKRAFQIVSGVLSIGLGAYFFIGGIIVFAAYSDYYGGLDSALSIAFIFEIALGVVLLIMGILYCLNPKKINGAYKKKIGIPVTNIVFAGILLVLLILGTTDSSTVIWILLLLLDIGFTIAEMCLAPVKNVKEENATATQENVETEKEERENLSIGETELKLKELKNLLDQNLITEEQYKLAVDKILNKI